MFLGISHLILTINKITDEQLNVLRELGYEIDFISNNIPNNKEKIIYMKNNNKVHNIIFLKHKVRYAIEIIEYNNTNDLESNILISFEKKISNKDKEVNIIQEKSIYYNEMLNIEYFISLENSFIFKVNDLYEEVKFWNQLGFKEINSSIKIKSPLVQWKGNIEFVENIHGYRYMDNKGVNTICLLTNNIEKERDKINTDTSEIFQMKINKKEMSNLLLKRDSYNIELLEIK